MSQQLILEISDEAYEDLKQEADAVELSAAEWAIALLSKQNVSKQNNAKRTSTISADRKEQAWRGFKGYAGSIGLGQAADTDNDSIDADLAKAYANEY